MILNIRNFRSIEAAHIELAPITVVYGANGSGKSSLLYSLSTLKNIILNPNQNPSGFFNFAFASLGGFDAVVFDHRRNKRVEIGIELEGDGYHVAYNVAFVEAEAAFTLQLSHQESRVCDLSVTAPLPYLLNQPQQNLVQFANKQFKATFNGVTTQFQTEPPTAEPDELSVELATHCNAPVEVVHRVGMVPLKRGFAKPHYSPVSVNPLLANEDEVASLLANDKYLVSKVSHYLEKVVGRDLRCSVQPGVALFSLDATDRNTGISTELVNEGFGVNQLVDMLTRTLYQDSDLMCMEEPEIHLHPSAVRKMTKVLADIVGDEDKRFIVSSHSEAFLTGLLSLVSEGRLAPGDLACYFVKKEGRRSVFERQEVNEQGQLEGGLVSFMEGESQDMAAFLGVSETG